MTVTMECRYCAVCGDEADFGVEEDWFCLTHFRDLLAALKAEVA